jgi:hypothetical protein
MLWHVGEEGGSGLGTYGHQLSRGVMLAPGDHLPRWQGPVGAAAGWPSQEPEGLERTIRIRRARFSRIKTVNRATPLSW